MKKLKTPKFYCDTSKIKKVILLEKPALLAKPKYGKISCFKKTLSVQRTYDSPSCTNFSKSQLSHCSRRLNLPYSPLPTGESGINNFIMSGTSYSYKIIYQGVLSRKVLFREIIETFHRIGWNFCRTKRGNLLVLMKSVGYRQATG